MPILAVISIIIPIFGKLLDLFKSAPKETWDDHVKSILLYIDTLFIAIQEAKIIKMDVDKK